MKIRKVIREDLPETNSSSSHSVVICMEPGGSNLNREEWGLKIDEDTQTLYIPKFYGFGRRFFCSNSVLVKLQYFSCFFISGLFKNKISMSKAMHKFELALKDILGINHVVFEEAADVWTQIHDGDISDEDINYYEFPSIDWQSYYDIKEEILESPETIKNFLLNPNSWLYGGDDSDDFISSRYSSTQKQPSPIGYFSADLLGIGRVDVEITALSDLHSELYSVFSEFCCDIGGNFIMHGDKNDNDSTHDCVYNDYDNQSQYLIYTNWRSKSTNSIEIKVPVRLTLYDNNWLSI